MGPRADPRLPQALSDRGGLRGPAGHRRGRTGHLAEELGDLLFQVVFHSQVAAEAGEFTMSDVLDRLIEKMTRRHPHVFGDRRWPTPRMHSGSGSGSSATRVAEPVSRAPPSTAFRSLPALLRAQRLQVKAGRVGFDWPTWRQAWDKVREEVAEMDEALDLGRRREDPPRARRRAVFRGQRGTPPERRR